jgi:hypothetical protein
MGGVLADKCSEADQVEVAVSIIRAGTVKRAVRGFEHLNGVAAADSR